MAIVQKFGKPSLFVTMTCNPKWPEIIDNLTIGESVHYRPDLVVRVFHCKLKELIDNITKDQIFGKVAALIYTIEFQKRGLPHAHILITLDEEDRIRDVDVIDKYVSAELPDIELHPSLHDKVKSHMIHGPCGYLNPNSVCMRDGQCSKKFPKEFSESTQENHNGYATYKRRDTGVTVNVRGHSVDNRFVVPYNPFLLQKFNCHINTEVCSSVRSIKYVYKYIYKGYDCANIQFSRDDQAQIVYDEIDSFVNCRYVGSTEATWRIFKYEMHYQSHKIERLDCHLPQQQTVYFQNGNEAAAAANPKQTKLEAFFKLNQRDSDANNLLYIEIPQNYTWDSTRKEWRKRQRGGEKVVTRLYNVSPKNVELFHLRLLLLHVKGAKGFEDVLTVDGILHETFLAAANARGIACNDNEWQDTIAEATTLQSPRQLRQLFGVICGIKIPGNCNTLWEQFKDHLCEDLLRDKSSQAVYNLCLLEIEDILITHNTSCAELRLPIPNRHLTNIDSYDVMEQGECFNHMFNMANDEQKAIITEVIGAIENGQGEKVLCLTVHAGCGKTYVQKTLLLYLRSKCLDCLPCTFSGIAASLLVGGRTLHNQFKLPIPVTESSVSSIKANSAVANRIRRSALILIDKISMCPIYALKTIDRLLRDLSVPEGREKMLGGKAVLLCGDFRQTLPVVPHAGQTATIELCVKSLEEWPRIKQLTLTQNMRALPSELVFISFLKQIGDGTYPIHSDLGDDIIELPQQFISSGDIIDEIYNDFDSIITINTITDRAILSRKNKFCHSVNEKIMSRMPGEFTTYYSFDKIVTDDVSEQLNFSTEFLNSIELSGLPPHKLKLKVNAVVMLIRNLDTAKALISGTRLRVKHLYPHTIDVEVLNGASSGLRVLIPRIHLRPNTALPFAMQRTQFPIIPAFAMTVNKSQGQSIGKVGIMLEEPVFGHGQLYVACSRARSFEGLKF